MFLAIEHSILEYMDNILSAVAQQKLNQNIKMQNPEPVQQINHSNFSSKPWGEVHAAPGTHNMWDQMFGARDFSQH